MVIPNSDLQFMRNVPLMNDGKNFIQFPNQTAQYNWFSNYVDGSLTLADYLYIQEGEASYVTVSHPVERIETCNMIRYRNTSYNTKWFYAFIDRIDYIADGTTRVYFSEDIFSTWQFTFNYKPCFVEREHTNNDAIGANTVEEPITFNDYVITDSTIQNIPNNFDVFIFSSDDLSAGLLPPNKFTKPAFLDGAYNTLWVCKAGSGLTAEWNAILNNLLANPELNAAEKIVCITLAPTGYFTGEGGGVRSGDLLAAENKSTISPKNNKLLTYPYTMLEIIAGGKSNILKYELFSANPQFKYYATLSPSPDIVYIPQNYSSGNLDMPIIVTGFPTLPWIKDYFQTWLARNTGVMKFDILTGFLGAAGGVALAAAGAPATMAGGGINDFASTGLSYIRNGLKAIDSPNAVSGSYAGNSYTYAGLYVARTFCKSIKKEYAEIADNFFSKYGYATQKTKAPNVTGRRNWNYVKTNGSIVTGASPTYATRFISNAMNNGCTFWHGKGIGEYGNFDNPII